MLPWLIALVSLLAAHALYARAERRATNAGEMDGRAYRGAAVVLGVVAFGAVLWVLILGLLDILASMRGRARSLAELAPELVTWAAGFFLFLAVAAIWLMAHHWSDTGRDRAWGLFPPRSVLTPRGRRFRRWAIVFATLAVALYLAAGLVRLGSLA